MKCYQSDNKGFIILSKAAFRVKITDTHCKTMSFNEAWLRLLTKVNHSQGKVILKGTPIRCIPGESMMTLASWTRFFGWSRYYTKAFFERLTEMGYVKTQCYKGRFCVCICAYDQWVKGKKGNVNEERFLPLFRNFWEIYHKITGMTKIDRVASYEIWKQLSEEEMKMAIGQITPYMETRLLTSREYNKSAKMYLKEKAFIF